MYLQVTDTMDYRLILPYLTVGILYFTKEVMGQARLPVPCPPPFPDFEAIFAQTLRRNPRFMEMKQRAQMLFNRPPNCSCSPALMGDIEGINQFRCERRTPILKVCPTKSTKLPTIPTEPSTNLETSSTRPLPPGPTIRYSSGGQSPITTPVYVDIPEISSTVSRSRHPNVVDLGETTTPLEPLSPSGFPPSSKPVTDSDDQITIVVIAVGAGVLLLIFLIGFLLLCRKRLCVGNGALGAHLKHEKVQRLRSDCQPISAISRGDTFEDGYAASMDDPEFLFKISSAGSVRSAVSVDYPAKRGYVTNGRKWRPEFDSDTSSDKYSADPKYILLREDSSASALSFSNHYNTLHTIEHPHALMMGGFGESSTDVTLPRAASKKKKSKRIANGDISLDSIEDPMGLMPSTSSLRRIQSKDSLNSIEIYDRVSKPRSFRLNGYANGHGPPPELRMETGEESDNASLDTIDKADEVLGEKTLVEGDVTPKTTAKTGIINLSYEPEQKAGGQAAPNWQEEVIDELKKKSDENDKYDSLVNEKNSSLFGYENKAIDSSDSNLDPPSDFRDSRESEISVAIVQPLKQEAPKQRRFSKKDNGKRPSWSPNSKKQPPPVARKPSNGFTTDPKKLSVQDSISSPQEVAINGKIIEKSPVMNSKEPLFNGIAEPVMMNGHGPMVNGHVEAETENELGRVKKFVFDIQQKDAGLKPSAHVHPQVQRYGDTRL